MNFSKLQKLYIDFDKELSKDYKEPNVFSDKALNISIQIVEEIDSIFDGRKNEDNKNENKRIETISRLQSFKKIKGFEVLNVDELLDKIIEKIENILSFNVIKLGYDIFPSSKLINIVETGNKDNKFEKEKESVDKFGVLIKLLIDNNINLDDIVIYEESLNADRMRQYPYKLIHLRINGVNKTIVTSDEIGQATFVYDGLINLELFNKFSKGDEIEGILSKKIVYSNNFYYDNLYNFLFLKSDINSEYVNEGIINIDEKLIEKYGLKTLLGYRRDLEGIEGELKEKANIYKIDLNWFLEKGKSYLSWPLINGKKLRNFPNNNFNIENNLGNKYGNITSISSLEKLFSTLGMKILDNKIFYKNELLLHESELKQKANVYKVGGKWFFGYTNGYMTWPKINGKNLKDFPSLDFIETNGLGGIGGRLSTGIHLKKLFKFLGIDVIEDDKEVYRKDLENIEEELIKKLNIYKIDGKWFFGHSQGLKTGIKINGIALENFPSGKIIKKNGFLNNKGLITTLGDLKKLFKFLGIDVIEDDKEVYRKDLENIEEELRKKLNLYKIDGKWYFGECLGLRQSGITINGKSIYNFPNFKFNIDNNILLGNKKTLNIDSLKTLFKFLGMEVID